MPSKQNNDPDEADDHADTGPRPRAVIYSCMSTDHHAALRRFLAKEGAALPPMAELLEAGLAISVE